MPGGPENDQIVGNILLIKSFPAFKLSFLLLFFNCGLIKFELLNKSLLMLVVLNGLFNRLFVSFNDHNKFELR
jgi:hypothetical protein